ncbi:MAG: asparagine synthase C-terminal domain-containing protein, partial [Candidatus Methanomethylicaceae archaeon]
DLAKHLGIIFHEVELRGNEFVDFFPSLVRIMDEPIADIAAFGHYAAPRAAAEHGIKVLLSGTGGDEVFWGYPWVRRAVEINEFLVHHPFLAMLRKFPRAFWQCEALWKIGSHFRMINTYSSFLREIGSLNMRKPPEQLFFYEMVGDFAYARFLCPRVYGSAMRDVSSDNAFLPMAATPSSKEEIPLTIIRLLFDTYLTSNCVALSDRVAMGCGVEVRLPFLDVRLIESVMAMRRRNADHHLGHKAWLRVALKGILPEEILARPKAGFQPPMIEWIDGVIKRYRGMLPTGHLVTLGVFDPFKIDRLGKGRESKSYNELFFLYKIILLEVWYRVVVRGEVF